MIDVRGLRIGNYVIASFLNSKIEEENIIAKAAGIKPDEVFFVGKVHRSLPLVAIEPIPLTEEMLLKCGFRKIRENLFRLTVIENELVFDFRINPEMFQITTFKNKRDGGYEQIATKVEFMESVHQLQNLYFDLTGKELEIKL